MFPYLGKVEPPSDDKRWKIVGATMRKLGNERDALIEALHSMQHAFGFLDKPGLAFVAATLRIPLSRVYGAATFYHHFALKLPGKHNCVICTGTACYIKGAGRLVETMAEQHGVKPGETTPDGELSLLTARCFGACGLAPVVVVDGEVTGRVTPEKLASLTQGVIQIAH